MHSEEPVRYTVEMSLDEFGNAMIVSPVPSGRIDAKIGQSLDSTAEPSIAFKNVEIRADRAGLLEIADVLIQLAHSAPGREDSGEKHVHLVSWRRNREEKHAAVTVRLVTTKSLPLSIWEEQT